MTPTPSTRPQTDVNHDLLDQLVDGAFALTDARGKIVKWTEGASALLGWVPAEVIGRSGFEAPLICQQPDLGGQWTDYLSRKTEQAPSSEVDVLALHRDGNALGVAISLVPVGLELGLEVNFFLKALDLDLPRDIKADYLRREHSIVVDTLTDAQARGPEATAGQTIAGVLLLMRATGEPVATPDELNELAEEMRIEPVDDRTSSAIVPGPPLPIEVPDTPELAAAPVEDAPDSLVAARERLERARTNEQDARRRVGELEGLLESAEALAAAGRAEADRTGAELAAMTNDREQLQDRLATARADREQARERYEQAEQELDSLRDRIEEMDFATRQAQLEAEQARDELARRSDEDAGLREKLEKLETERTGGEERLAAVRDNLETVTRRSAALETDLVKSARESEELREALATGKLQAERSEAERLLAIDRADALQAALEQVRAAAVEATKWLDGGLPARLEAVLGELSSTRHDAAELRARLAGSVEDAPQPAQPAPAASTAAVVEAVDERPAEPAEDDVAGARALITPEGRFFELSPAFCDRLGYAESDLKRAMWPPATDRARASELKDITRRVLEGEVDDARVETEYLDAHGVPVSIIGTLTRIEGPDGAPELVELMLDAD